jgi:hypothetical protein
LCFQPPAESAIAAERVKKLLDRQHADKHVNLVDVIGHAELQLADKWLRFPHVLRFTRRQRRRGQFQYLAFEME